MTLYIILFLLSILISSISQILLKSSANKLYTSKLKEYLNPCVIFAYILFFGSSLLTVIAYREVPLSLGAVLESSGYIFVSILSYFILKEKISKRKRIGLLIIIAGIILSNL